MESAALSLMSLGMVLDELGHGLLREVLLEELRNKVLNGHHRHGLHQRKNPRMSSPIRWSSRPRRPSPTSRLSFFFRSVFAKERSSFFGDAVFTSTKRSSSSSVATSSFFGVAVVTSSKRSSSSSFATSSGKSMFPAARESPALGPGITSRG